MSILLKLLVINFINIHGNEYVYCTSTERNGSILINEEEYVRSDSNFIVESIRERCALNGNLDEVDSGDYLNFTLSNELFKTDVLVPDIIYQIKINRMVPSISIDFLLVSQLNGTLFGEFLTKEDEDRKDEIEKKESDNCRSIGKFRGHLKESLDEMKIYWAFHLDSDIIKSNLTFRLDYQLRGRESIHRMSQEKALTKDCQLHLLKKESTLSNKNLTKNGDCQVWFPNHGNHGIIIELARLNVPCSKGYLHFSGSDKTLTSQQHQHFKSHKQSHLCGKLEELPEGDRRIYFPASHTTPFMKLINNPVFSLTYHSVDYCYNITLSTKNGSFELKPTGNLMCTFKIYLPYGNRIALTLQIGTGAGKKPLFSTFQELENEQVNSIKCDGLETKLFDGEKKWTYCMKSGDVERQIEILSRGNRVSLQVTVRNIASSEPIGLSMKYRASPIEEIVGLCEFGWIASRQFCVSSIENVKLPWTQAEMECVKKGGHLASIRSEHTQNIIDNLLLNSPGYRDDNAYWIGASDRSYEGDFRWSDGLPFSYSNWFPGWSQHGHYNRQPNDDGLSNQDCVEIRRIYALPTSVNGIANDLMWNDRDCSTSNYFVCEKLQNDEPLEDTWPLDCNKTVSLTRQHPRALISSPGFPRQYPDNVDCHTYIHAPSGYRILLDFEELVMENEPTCSYDFLEILEYGGSDSKNHSFARRLCGDWSAKLKLLRYISTTSKLILKFSSDYSHHFGGYKARVSMENVVQCADDRHQIFNNSCYLFVSYPEVTWSTAQHICAGIKSNLASVLSADEERFINTNLRKTPEYRTSALYWLGGRLDKSLGFHWIDENPVKYTGWLPNQKPLENLRKSNETSKCLGVQWTPSPTPSLPSGLYWKSKRCNSIGGYVCKKINIEPGEGLNFNKTVNGTEGHLTSPNYPGNYYNNLDYTIKIIGPKRTRLVVKFEKLDLEQQMECLYDFIELRSIEKTKFRRLCGSHDIDMHQFDYVSDTNEISLIFHSDYSISSSGFSLKWYAVDVSFCPTQTLTAKEGFITSPNYPDFLLPHLNCTIIIRAPKAHKIWLDFLEVNLNEDAFLEMNLGENKEYFRPYTMTENLLTEGSFLSDGEMLKIRLETHEKPNGIGFKAHYKTINVVKEEKNIFLGNATSGILLNLNYPDNPLTNVDFMQHFIAPLGSIISLELYNFKLTNTDCYEENGIVEIYDNYADMNGTVWKLCYDLAIPNSISTFNHIEINSFLNTIHLRQLSVSSVGVSLNGTLKVQPDEDYMGKLMKFKNEVESCKPNPCQHGGKCITKNLKKFCECTGHFTGMFCALTKCDLNPCIFGTCELTPNAYKCHCKPGYSGPTCEQKRKPCEGNPCESRGMCLEKGDGFICRCHAWWEGPRCEKRMLHIPYKPLSERMLHEPFWLGLMTVFVVMGVIGLIWCAKRHFPEKIEKLLAEENERNRSTMSSLRSASVREQLAAASAATSASGQASVTVTPSQGPGAPRSLFGRLGTPSPKNRRINSTPTKKNAAEKKQILQQLVSPSSKRLTRKVSLGELMQMSDIEPEYKNENQLTVKETKFIENNTTQSVLNDPKLEKKVHFARLLNKVSAEMTSSSDIELGLMHSNRLSCSFMRTSSTPPSPCMDTRSPNSTSSNQGSDSFSSDLAIPSALSSSISDLLIRRHTNDNNNKMSNGRQKPTSADSILAMFRNFSSSSAGINLSPSLKVSPSTTPTGSSPQDDIVGDDESSTSSIHTPVSFSSGAPESPVMHLHNPQQHSQSTIEIPVLDSLSAHKSQNNGSNLLHPPSILLEIPSTINKCLSPIRELPTPLPSPMPSPALTPIMRRNNLPVTSSIEDNDLSDDRISVELPNVSGTCSDLDDDDIHCIPDINLDLQAEDGLIVEEVAAMQQNLYKTKVRPPPLGRPSDSSKPETLFTTPLIIPTLMVETPSPTFAQTFPGSPPPHKHKTPENCFQFPPKQQPRKMLKEFDKPTSLDLPCNPPMITITCNMSEVESDAEPMSPAVKNAEHLPSTSSNNMCYLSPFSMGTRGEQHASESNLSSSGYSSMASPGPSRCGSSNPLCPSEMEDQGPPGSGHSNRRPSPILRSKDPTECDGNSNKTCDERRRGRSDSETLSDDVLIESNDEGIGTDHLEEKIDKGRVKSAKDLEMLMQTTKSESNSEILIDFSDTNIVIPSPNLPSKNCLQLPSIVVQCEEKTSPVSSLIVNEKPCERTCNLSSDFYTTKKNIFTFDSDGLYDFPNSFSTNPKKINGRKRERKQIRNCKTPSPTKSFPISQHLEIPTKEISKIPPPRKLSPKRRITRTQQMISSSSSSDSVTSTKDIKLSSSSPSPDTIRWSSSAEWVDFKKAKFCDNDDSPDEALKEMLPKVRKIGKLKAISHQIRRIETSLKRRERSISPSDSIDSNGEDSPGATSPLLQRNEHHHKHEIRKSNSIGKLPSSSTGNNTSFSSTNRKGKYKRSYLFSPGESWKRVVITGNNGHSD